jgi:hypothetical protein
MNLKKVLEILSLYIAMVGVIWGFLEGFTYFQGDTLKHFVGKYWLLMYIAPILPTTLMHFTHSNKETIMAQEHIQTEGDYSPGKVDGNYHIGQVTKPSQKVDETKVGNSTSRNINTKGDYSPGQVGGDYIIGK